MKCALPELAITQQRAPLLLSEVRWVHVLSPFGYLSWFSQDISYVTYSLSGLVDDIFVSHAVVVVIYLPKRSFDERIQFPHTSHVCIMWFYDTGIMLCTGTLMA